MASSGMLRYITLPEFPLRRADANGYLLDLGEVYPFFELNPEAGSSYSSQYMVQGREVTVFNSEPRVEGVPVSQFINDWAGQLGAASTVKASDVGGWLTNPESVVEGGNWAGPGVIPFEFSQRNENLIVYMIDAGSTGAANLVGSFGIDNTIAVWVNGEYRFGAYSLVYFDPEGTPFENVSLGPLRPGINSIQILRGDWTGFAGADWTIALGEAPPVKPDAGVYTLIASQVAVEEGGWEAEFVLYTTGVAPGTVVEYSLSGIQREDINLALRPDLASLSGQMILNAQGTGIIRIPIARDRIAESETLTVTIPGVAGAGPLGVASSRIVDVEYNTISILFYPNGRGSAPVLLKDLEEAIASFGGSQVSHTASYAGLPYDVPAYASQVLTVLRNGDFTREFRDQIRSIPEIAQYAGLSYQEVVNLVGRNNPKAVDDAIVFVGSYRPSSAPTPPSGPGDTVGGGAVPFTETSTVTAIFAPGVLRSGSAPMLIENMSEEISYVNGVKSTHSLSLGPEFYDLGQFASQYLIVLRNGEFTPEFRQEIRDIPSLSKYADYSYQDVVALVGAAGMPAAIISVAGADGNFVG